MARACWHRRRCSSVVRVRKIYLEGIERPGVLLCSWLLSISTVLAGNFQPARFSSGPLPLPPPQTTGWDDVWLQVSLSADGTVDRITTLHGTQPLAGILRAAAAQWRFEPASEAADNVDTTILVAAVYRPPTLFDTPGQAELPTDLASASATTPIPTFRVPAAYPPRALGDGVVLVEVLVNADGLVRVATVIRSSGTGFNASAIASATRWRFHPARRGEIPTPTFAYLVFGFRAPVVIVQPPR